MRLKFGNSRHFATMLAMAAVSLCLLGAAPASERGNGMVSSDHALASQAGAEILAAGGNAVDAAVGTALAAGVVQPAGSGLGGGGFAVIVNPDGTQTTYDFREVAPSRASADMFRTADGEVDRMGSRKGPGAIAVPGESRGLARLMKAHGSLPFRVVAAPAIRYASGGFPLGGHLASAIGNSQDSEVQTLFEGIGSRPGSTVRRPELAGTLRRWVTTQGEDLHKGLGARRIAEEGGPTLEDLSAYEVREREPIVVEWGERTIVTMPLPSSGGVVLAQVLQVLEGHDLASMGHNSSDMIHLVTETFKHAYADRANHLGDPDFVEVQVDELIGEARVEAIRTRIWPGRTFATEHYGERIEPLKDAGTQHISVVDGWGGAVALTTTINTSFGSGRVAEGTGVILNNEMDDFASAPGVANAYGLIGNAANKIEAGKRPLSSMTPTVVLGPDGTVELVVGASGGSKIISSTIQVLLNVLVFEMEPGEAVSAPRFHHQWIPDALALEAGIPEDVARDLEGRGHEVVRMKTRLQCDRDFSFPECFHASVQAISVDGTEALGGADPRKGGEPRGVWRN